LSADADFFVVAASGVNRHSDHLFDERNGAVEKMVAMAIDAARRNNKKIGICGQAPSDYPEFARFLVERGINSISLNPDTVIQTTQMILETEKQLKGNSKLTLSREKGV
jgi:pyruvate, water dikinase